MSTRPTSTQPSTRPGQNSTSNLPVPLPRARSIPQLRRPQSTAQLRRPTIHRSAPITRTYSTRSLPDAISSPPPSTPSPPSKFCGETKTQTSESISKTFYPTSTYITRSTNYNHEKSIESGSWFPRHSCWGRLEENVHFSTCSWTCWFSRSDFREREETASCTIITQSRDWASVQVQVQ